MAVEARSAVRSRRVATRHRTAAFRAERVARPSSSVKRTQAAPHAIENAEVARIFREIADLLEIQDANAFRIRAYRNAARTVEELSDAAARIAREDPARLTQLPGIGKGLAGKIAEICETGTLGTLTELQREAPPGALELMRLPGLGPKRARFLCDTLKIHSIADLEKAAKAARIRSIRGFGVRTEQKILEELHARTGEEERFLRSVAAQYGDSYLRYMEACDDVQRVEIAGSFRRCKETVADLDILAATEAGETVVKHFVEYPEVRTVLAQGPTKASVRLKSGLQVDLRVLPPQSYGAALHYFTGSKAHNIAIRRLGQQRGLKINEYGVFRRRRRVGGAEEAGVFKAVGLPWIPPELREARGEIEAARQDELPKLIEPSDIRGDLQFHTTDSDGRDSLEGMAEAAQELGYEYIAVTDHSPALRMVRGLDAAGYRRQAKHIDKLNARLRKLTILKGAEIDILKDGSLDLAAEDLAMFDVVLVAIHSKFDLPSGEQTRRIVRALQHPGIDILAHPTGRIIGRRRAAAFDMEEVLHVAADQGVVIEINAQPERLDVDDVTARAAIARRIPLVISTDAHSVQELRFMRCGVDQARRAWAEKKHVINTRPLKQLLKMLHGERRR